MSLLDKNLEEINTGSNYTFSAAKIDSLGASEYTLVAIAVDASASVTGFADDLVKMLKHIVDACQKSDRRENLMLRLLQFNDSVDELHGFKQLQDIEKDDYTGILKIGGMTALNSATLNAVESVGTYGKQLMEQEILTNAIVFVITDGIENRSGFTADKIKDAVNKINQDECLESLTVVLIGVTNGSTDVDVFLNNFRHTAGINQYVDIGSASPSTLAKLAQFVSQSISSTSKALGSGQGSQPISFSV